MSKPLWMLVREAFERKNYFSPPTELRDELVGIATDYAQQQTAAAAARAEIEWLRADLQKAHEGWQAEVAVIRSIADDNLARAEKAEAERDAARAQVKAAYAYGWRDGKHPDASKMPLFAQAALEAYGREKVREGMRRAADVLAQEFNIRDIQIKGITVQGCEIAPPSWCRNAILAAMEKEGGE